LTGFGYTRIPCGTIDERRTYFENLSPPRVEYSLTARGQSLMPHVSALIGWALEHFDEITK